MEPLKLSRIEPVRPPSVTDQIFATLYTDVVTLAVPPGTKLSEAEVARQFGVSRQPVRDAFWRLSQLGFLVVRPQRATTVSQISFNAVLQARFIRTAIEIETARVAALGLTPAEFDELEDNLAQQAVAARNRDRLAFHGLDDDFHRRICEMAGLDFAWTLIRDTKAQMDRVRFLSLASDAELVLGQHHAILDALRARDPDAAVQRIRDHLARIESIIGRLRQDHPDVFADEPDPAPAGLALAAAGDA